MSMAKDDNSFRVIFQAIGTISDDRLQLNARARIRFPRNKYPRLLLLLSSFAGHVFLSSIVLGWYLERFIKKFIFNLRILTQ